MPMEYLEGRYRRIEHLVRSLAGNCNLGVIAATVNIFYHCTDGIEIDNDMIVEMLGKRGIDWEDVTCMRGVPKTIKVINDLLGTNIVTERLALRAGSVDSIEKEIERSLLRDGVVYVHLQDPDYWLNDLRGLGLSRDDYGHAILIYGYSKIKMEGGGVETRFNVFDPYNNELMVVTSRDLQKAIVTNRNRMDSVIYSLVPMSHMVAFFRG